MTDRKTTNTDVVWACLLIIGIGGLGTWHYGRKLAKAMRTENWQPVAGEIVQSETRPISPGMTYQHAVEFSYRYRVGEQEFTGY